MSDLIDRQAAIDAIEQMQMPIMRSIFPEEQFVFKGMSEALSAIKELPSAQPEKRTQERTGTHACDCISRQSAYATALAMYVRCDTGDIEDYRDLMCESILVLPSAQQKPLKYTGESICLYCQTENCDGCMYEPMMDEQE